MAKFLEQVILLTRKNLKIRFSHRCVTFCELFIPLFITAVIGLIASYVSREPSGSVRSPGDASNYDKSIDEKFMCKNASAPSWMHMHSGSSQYQCETTYDHINSDLKMRDVRALNVTYLFDDKVVRQVGYVKLAEAIMTRVLGDDDATSSRTNWTKSSKSERELEVCVMQDREACKMIYAVVIITNIRDWIERESKFVIEYKIRVRNDLGMRDFHTDRLFVDFSNPYYMHATLDEIERLYMSSKYETGGFVDIQTFMDQGIMDYVISKNGTRKAEEVEISLVKMPFIYASHDPASAAGRVFAFVYSLMFSLTIFSLMRVNSEKFSGFKELLRMHGVSAGTQWMSWLVSSFIVYVIWTALLTLLLYLPLLGGRNILPAVGINCFLYWILLILFVISITTFCFLVSVFFERVWTAVSIGLVSWILLTVFMMVVSGTFHSLTKWTAIGVMLVPTVAFDFGFRLVLNGGGTFRMLASQVIENVPLTTLHCLFMLLLDSCIFMTLTMYLDNVLPSKYGVRKPPLYFIRDCRKFLMKFKRGSGNKYQVGDDEDELTHTDVEMTSIISGETEQPYQSDPDHVEAAVVIQNLRKEFKNKKRAVDGLSAKMFTGEIYALLGFNGAGKTSTIGVLTGLTAPSNGIARIFDLDIRKDMEEIRKYIGLCPQHNLLFEEMSVLDQVAFFGKLKGVGKPKEKAIELLTSMGMSDKLHNKPEELSGGQKRRAHLAIALIGETKMNQRGISHGLDPETRRGVWDILLKLRGKITIILTTHDMEEADLLGDRIGILSEGKMICSGTPSFLKKYYGVGYNLKMSATAPECDPEKVYNFTRKYVPSAKMESKGVFPLSHITSANAALDSVSISLPTADLDLCKVADLMEALREQQDHLGIGNIGLSLSTMDEVFLKVGEVVQAVSITVPSCDPSSKDVSSSRYVGTRLQWYRYKTLVFKRMMYFCSAPFTLLFLVVLFSTILLTAMTSLSNGVSSAAPTDPRVVSASSITSYNLPTVLLHENGESNLGYTLAYLSQLHSHAENSESVQVKEFPKTTSFDEIATSLMKTSINDIHNYRQHYIAGASFNKSVDTERTNVAGYFSAYALHSAPLSLNLLTQTLIKEKSGVDAKIEVVNHPFKSSQPYFYISPDIVDNRNRDPMFYAVKSGGAIILVIIISLLTATSALLPAEERLNKGKHLQLMTGTTPFLYWSAMFTWDFLFFSMANVIITLMYVLADSWSGNWVYTNNNAAGIIFLILECHSFAALWFCYLISWAPCIRTGTDAFLIVNTFAIIIGILWNVIRHILLSLTTNEFTSADNEYGIKSLYYISHLSGYVLWVVPMHSLYLSLLKLSSVSFPNSICNWFPKDVLHLSCDKVVTDKTEDLYKFIHSCCENCKKNCFQPQPYFNTSSDILFGRYETHSLIFDILAMILCGLLCAGVLFSLEYLLPHYRGKRQMEKMANTANSANEPETTTTLATEATQDEDVAYEVARVQDIVKDNALETANHALILHNLQLQFGKLKAVKGLSFGVHRGECFGLLGVNSAGKTSTFKMITGDIFPTNGNMYSGGLNCYNHRASYLSTLGYCPQFDGIIGSLTGIQVVKIYGALRGIPPERLQEDATIWLDKFGLLGSANKKCANFSGGMKRRLSAAMALIGNPKLLLLDEPTTGVDPAFRRQFWNVIKEIREGGQSVVLTSHTMDECEELCTRLAIMVNGQFKCLGNIQHLKSKFGKGYILTVKLKKVSEEQERENEEKVKLVLEKIVEKFSPCRVQTKQRTLVQYQVLNKCLWYSDLFRTMEQIRSSDSNHELIEEYSITETSLEDIFISFAQKENMRPTE